MNLAGEKAEYLQVTDVVHILKPNRSFDFSASSCSLSIETQPQSIQNRSDLRARAGAEAEDGERAEAEDGRLRWRAAVSAVKVGAFKKRVRVIDIYMSISFVPVGTVPKVLYCRRLLGGGPCGAWLPTLVRFKQLKGTAWLLRSAWRVWTSQKCHAFRHSDPRARTFAVGER